MLTLGLHELITWQNPRMKRVLFASLLLAALLPAGAVGRGSAAVAPSADVEAIAVVVLNVGTTSTTNFNFNVYNCPSGNVISITWDAEQVEPGTAATGDGLFITSTGDQVQHFVVSAVGSLRPGYMWTGSGVVTCGAVPIAVAGSGQTKSTQGV